MIILVSGATKTFRRFCTFSKWPDKYFPAALRWLGQLESQSHFLGYR